MTDEEFVRKHWDVEPFYHRTESSIRLGIILGPKAAFSDWSKTESEQWANAAGFTRNRLEELRQLGQEIGMVCLSLQEIRSKWWNQPMDSRSVRSVHRWSRILNRLEAQMTELKRGLKP
jgi:hypothetical protein